MHSSSLSAVRAVPFFIELVYIVEWLCTPTTLSLYDFIRVEEIYILVRIWLHCPAEHHTKADYHGHHCSRSTAVW